MLKLVLAAAGARALIYFAIDINSAFRRAFLDRRAGRPLESAAT